MSTIDASGCETTKRRNSPSSRAAAHIGAGLFVAIVSLACRSLVASSITRNNSLDPERRLGESQTIGVWIAMACMAVLMKLTSSADDICWLLPFISSTQKRRNACFYICCMQVVVWISWGFTVGGEKLLALFVPDDPNWPLSRVLQLMSAVMLTLYTFKLFWEWWKEWRSSGDDESATSSATTEPSSNEGSWEAAWDPVVQRYYYQDRTRGISSWRRPEDCNIYLPRDHPGESIGSHVAESSSNLPPGWLAAWDCNSKRFYYHNCETLERTWDRPEICPEKDTETSCQAPPALRDDVLNLEAVNVGHLEGESAHGDQAIIERGHQTNTDANEASCMHCKSPSSASDNSGGKCGGTLEPAKSQESQASKDEAGHEKFTISKLITISLMGSMDDFAVFVSLMLSDVMSAPQLMVGVLLGSMIVVVLCAGAGLFACVVRTIEKVPLWCIIGAFATWTYISTFVMDSE